MNFSKYHAKPVTIDGIRFASKKEGSRYCELKVLARAGKISDLQLQVPFVLSKAHRRTGEKRMTSGKKYVADFVYFDCINKRQVVEDVKGFRTKEYLVKREWMFEKYGIEIHEV